MPLPASPMTMQDGMRAVQKAFASVATPPRWPMYVRQAKQFLRNAVDGFDERHYGFSSVVDLLRAAGKEGILRVERDRQGAVRVFAGPKLAVLAAVDLVEPAIAEGIVVAEVGLVAEALSIVADPVGDEEPIEDGETTQDAAAIAAAGIVGGGVTRKRPRRREPVKALAGSGTTAARPVRPRARKTVRAKAVATGRS